MSQMKEQCKTTAKELNYLETITPGREFNIKVIKPLSGLDIRVGDLSESFDKEKI